MIIISDWKNGIHRKVIPSDPNLNNVLLLTIDQNKIKQQVEGFGGAFTRASALLLRQMSEEKRQEALNLYFDAVHGARYTLCRMPMGGCDFAEYAYTYDDHADDVELAHFSIEPDLDTVLPIIHAAKEMVGNDFRLYACPWSPPAWMKDTGRLEFGGRLLKKHYPTMAQYFVRFLEAYNANGIRFWGVSSQNEPNECLRWPTCMYSAQEEAEFVGMHLVPALDAAGFSDVRVLIWDNNKDLLLERVEQTMEACKRNDRIWGVAFHWYAGDYFDQMDDVRYKYPELKLLSTECCTALHAPEGEIAAERYAHEMIGDFLHGACGYIDWNLFLDLEGGPSYVKNECLAPITLDSKHDRIIVNDAYDVMYQFSHFVHKGAHCIHVDNSSGLESVAFLNPDGSIVVQVLNRGDKALPVELEGERFQVPAHGMATYLKTKMDLSRR